MLNEFKGDSGGGRDWARLKEKKRKKEEEEKTIGTAADHKKTGGCPASQKKRSGRQGKKGPPKPPPADMHTIPRNSSTFERTEKEEGGGEGRELDRLGDGAKGGKKKGNN